MNTGKIRSFDELTKDLTARANVKRASAEGTKAAGADVPAAPEKDPQDKGNVSVPKDADANPAKQNTPESKENSDVTPTTQPPTAKKVEGEEKPPAIGAKIATAVAGLKDLQTKIARKAGAPASNPSGAPAPSDKLKMPQVAATLPPNDKTNDASTPKAAAPADGATDKAETSAPAVKVDDKKGEPNSATNTDSAMVPAKAAAAGEDVLDPSFHMKIASLVLESEEGRAMVGHLLEKQHGAETANDIIKAAMVMEDRALELAELEQQAVATADEMWKNASAEEREHIVKLAAIHKEAQAQYPTDWEKMAYAQGADMAAQMGDAGMMADPGADGALPPEADPAAAGGQITEQDIMQALEMMVQNGELDEQTAAQILQQLLGGGEGGGAAGAPPEGGMPPEAGAAPGGAPAMPPGAPAGGPPEAAPKGASKEKSEKKDKGGDDDKGSEKEASVVAKSTLALADQLLAAPTK